MLPTRPPRPRGFSVAEMCVVVALSAILALGLSALIDVPRELAVRHDGTNVARLSAADRVIRQLDDDVRFAKDVRTPGPGELVVVRADGETVRYRWEGVGRALSRSAPEGSGELLEQVTRVGFAIGWTEVDAGYEEGGLVSSPVAVARFSGFAALLGIAARLGRAPVDGAHAVGLYFRAAGLGEESGLVSEARVRLRRAGDEGLRVRLLRADPGSRQPIVGTELAGGVVASSALPLATTDVALPLTATKAVREGDPLFLELSSMGPGAAVEVEVETLPLGVPVPGLLGGVLVSAGGIFRPLAASAAAGQVVHAVTAVTQRVLGGGVTGAVESIPTSVLLSLELPSNDAPGRLDVSFPIANNLARVNR